MTWTNNPYCTLTQAQSVISVTNMTTADSAWISDDLIPQAQAMIDDYINHSYQTDGTSTSPATRYYNGRGLSKLMIDECMSLSKVYEIQHTVVVDAQTGMFMSGNTFTTDITADIITAPNNTTPFYVLRRTSGLNFIQGVQNYEVQGVFGNSTIPNDISRACARLVAHLYRMRDTNYADVMEETGTRVRQTYNKQIPTDVCEILERHRRRWFAARSS